MIIPEFLKDGDIVGVTACSAGVLDKLDDYLLSLDTFKSNGLNVIETSNVRSSGVVSSSSLVRSNELKSLYLNKDVKLINIASGGDFLLDMLSNVDFNVIKDNVKWIGGMSDPTSLLYIITTKLDIATIYNPCNMSGFNIKPMPKWQSDYFKIIKGDLVRQSMFPYRALPFQDECNIKNEWININGDVDSKGILIGGCIDVLKDIIGTKFDNTLSFLDKYKDQGIIWYFDVFSLTSEALYNTLIQFKYAGWFKYTDTILISKVCIPNTFTDSSYVSLIGKCLDGISVVYDCDFGHVKPSFTLINGARVRVVSNGMEHFIDYLND